jgi:hypothetical protein
VVDPVRRCAVEATVCVPSALAFLFSFWKRNKSRRFLASVGTKSGGRNMIDSRCTIPTRSRKHCWNRLDPPDKSGVTPPAGAPHSPKAAKEPLLLRRDEPTSPFPPETVRRVWSALLILLALARRWLTDRSAGWSLALPKLKRSRESLYESPHFPERTDHDGCEQPEASEVIPESNGAGHTGDR